MARKRYKSELRESREDAIKRVSSKLATPKDRRDVRWFREDEPHDEIFALDQRLGRLTAHRRALDTYHACLYDDAELGALMVGLGAAGEFTPQTMTSNIVKRQIDTYVERQEKNQPVPMVVPVDTTYEQGERAKDLTKLFKGIFEEVDYHAMLTTRRRDSAIWGTAIAHNYRIGQKLFHDRVFPWELRVDPREAMYGKPRTLLRRFWIDRLVLAERFPEHAEAIMADEYSPSDGSEIFRFDLDGTSDLVFVIQAWHLPNGEPTDEDDKDGSQAICIQSATLSHRAYKREYFPFSVRYFSDPVAGFWGEGMASLLSGLQFEVNAIGLRLQEQGWMNGSYVWTRPESGLETSQIDNGVLTHLVSEDKPEFFTPAPWHQSIFDYYMFLRGRAAAEETRQSEMGTRGELPAGLDSGKAIRNWNQLDDQAYLSHGKKDERDALNTAWQYFDLCEEIHEEEQSAKPKKGEKSKPFTIKSKDGSYGTNVARRLPYAKIRMDREDFDLDAYPTSLLNGTPSEQYQDAKEMAGDGLLSRDAVLDMLRIPDVDRVLRLETAPRRAVEKILAKILRSKDPESVYMRPEPAFNLELCRALALMTYLDAFTQEAPEENLRWVLEFALDAEEQIERENTPDDAGPETTPPMGGAPVNPAAMGQDPALFAPPPGPLLPAGAMPPQNIPLSPQV